MTELRLRRVGYRRVAPRLRHPSHTFGPSAWSKRCGLRCGWLNASSPLAKLTVDRDWIEVRLPLLVAARVHRSDVTDVCCARIFVMEGIRFVTRSGDFDGVIVFTRSADEILGALGRLGWPVTRSVGDGVAMNEAGNETATPSS